MTEAERRYELNSLLQEILGSNFVYFQPPENLKLHFPCIIYELSGKDVLHANDAKYRKVRRYTVTVVDKDPDSIIPLKIEELPLCTFDRVYVADNIYHSVYTLYY